jgi:trimethylamine--corrinoid protein Co-methyltransferase
MNELKTSNYAAHGDIKDHDWPEVPLTRKQISTIHDATVEVLSKTGFRFASERVQKIFQTNGFRVERDRVYFTEKEIMRALETVPGSFTIRARNPKYNICLEQGSMSFGLGRGAVNIVEPDGSYRTATKDDVIKSLKLGQVLDVIEHTGPLAYPSFDVDRRNVHLWQTYAIVKYTDKIYNIASRHDLDLIALAYGTDRDKLKKRDDLVYSPGQATIIVRSPLTITADDCINLVEYVECGIAVHVASMPVAGTTGPSTIAGTILLQNCENLAPIVLSQLIRPGCPAFYGALSGHADMISLRPRFGTPEARIMERAGCQMAHFYGLLTRGNTGLTDAPAYDFQSGAQAMLSTLSSIQNGPNFITGCGLLGSYMGASLAKIILDTEVIAIAKRYLSHVKTDRDALGIDVINEVGPGNTFLESNHTLNNFRSEFLTESLFRSLDYEKWNAMGKRMVVHLAREKALQFIDTYERPQMDTGLEREIEAYLKTNWIGTLKSSTDM